MCVCACVQFCHYILQGVEETLYPGSNVTKRQSLLLILSFFLRHCLTDAALEDLLLLLNVLLPNTVPATKYKFYKLVALEQYEVK